MNLAVRIRRTSIALAALLAMAAMPAPSSAGNPNAPGPCDEVQPKSKSGSEASNTATATRRENTSLGQTDEGYVPLTRTAPTATPSAPRPAETAAPALASPRSEKPAAVRKADAAASRAKRPAPPPPPAKVSLPNLPATPGMGTLLRVGITAGREIS